MQRFKVAAVQMNSLKDNLDHNLEVHESFSRQAASAGCRIVLFPELSTTAHYGDERVTQFAEQVPGGRIYELMLDLAKSLDLTICYGFCENAHGTFYNTQALVAPYGLVGLQRKIHASKDEYFSFRMGRTLEVFNVGFCRIGILVCYDARFFETWRVLALKGAEVVLLPHAARSGWGVKIEPDEVIRQMPERITSKIDRYKIYAADNAVFGVFGNQVGYNGHSTHFGGAFVLSPSGEVLSQAKFDTGDLLVSVELDPETLFRERNSPHCPLKTRRPEVYGEIVDMV
jgi:predicted amidohydrolase